MNMNEEMISQTEVHKLEVANLNEKTFATYVEPNDGNVPGNSGNRSQTNSSSLEGYIDTRCGYYKCKPKCLQQCATPKLLLVSMCVFAVIAASVQWGIVNVNISTWERRFQLSSTQSAWIIIAGDISSGILNPIFGYVGTFYHKGRMVFIGAVCMTIANLLFIIPHFASGTYELSGDSGEMTCDLGTNMTLVDRCDGLIDTDMSRWLPVFCVAQVLYGYVGCSMWTVGITWLDENVKAENSAMYIGIFNAFSALGACLGFVLGGFFLQYYVDTGRVDLFTIDLEPSDPRWVGAWWIGFSVAVVGALPALFLLPCFPKELPAAAQYRKERKSEAYKGIGLAETGRDNFGKSWRDLGYSMRVIFCNPVFDLITIAGIVEVGGVSAFAAYLPKIIQFQFGVTTTMAAVVAGAVLVPGAALGQLLGGIIPKVAKLRFRGIMWMLIIAQFTCVLCSVGFLVSCPTPSLAGYNTDYHFNSTAEYGDPFTQNCNAKCNCTTLAFIPICSQEQISYFSPCYAGCATEAEVDGVAMYKDCSCLPNITEPGYQAQDGLCSTQCSKFWVFMPLLLVLIIATFIENTGGYAVVMRCVPEKQRTFAFGIQAPLIKYVGNVPFPIIFGVIFDVACDVWQDNCGSQGSCWIYDSSYLSFGMFISCLIIKGISGTCFIIAVCIYKPPKDTPENDPDQICRNSVEDRTRTLEDALLSPRGQSCTLPNVIHDDGLKDESVPPSLVDGLVGEKSGNASESDSGET